MTIILDAGKTTLLRDVTGLLAERFGRRVVVVDTSNEIGGDGKVPHSCIGRARRMPVPHKPRQHEVLQEAVQNHNPEVRSLSSSLWLSSAATAVSQVWKKTAVLEVGIAQTTARILCANVA